MKQNEDFSKIIFILVFEVLIYTHQICQNKNSVYTLNQVKFSQRKSKTTTAWYKMFNTHATSIVHQGNEIHMEIVACSSAFCLGEGV